MQAGVIAEALAGRSALAVLPTGGGKSLCYQIPSMIRPGLGIVVSPLIALMADQVAGLQQSGVAAERLDSDTMLDDRSRIWRQIEAGELDLLYMSPEGLMQPWMLERLSRIAPRHPRWALDWWCWVGHLCKRAWPQSLLRPPCQKAAMRAPLQRLAAPSVWSIKTMWR